MSNSSMVSSSSSHAATAAAASAAAIAATCAPGWAGSVRGGWAGRRLSTQSFRFHPLTAPAFPLVEGPSPAAATALVPAAFALAPIPTTRWGGGGPNQGPLAAAELCAVFDAVLQTPGLSCNSCHAVQGGQRLAKLLVQRQVCQREGAAGGNAASSEPHPRAEHPQLPDQSSFQALSAAQGHIFNCPNDQHRVRTAKDGPSPPPLGRPQEQSGDAQSPGAALITSTDTQL